MSRAEGRLGFRVEAPGLVFYSLGLRRLVVKRAQSLGPRTAHNNKERLKASSYQDVSFPAPPWALQKLYTLIYQTLNAKPHPLNLSPKPKLPYQNRSEEASALLCEPCRSLQSLSYKAL